MSDSQFSPNPNWASNSPHVCSASYRPLDSGQGNQSLWSQLKLAGEVLDALFDGELKELDFVFEIEFGLDGEL